MAGCTSLASTNVYELRRIGSKATCANVKDVFRVRKHRNVFGRNSEKVDFYINSGIHKQLISRQHAELVIYQDDNKQPVFIFHDRSVNGTFVNDIKISKIARIKEFDTVTFGHVQGVSIKPGMYAEQIESEFRFILEKVLVTNIEEDLDISSFPHFSTCPLYCNNTKQSLNCSENKSKKLEDVKKSKSLNSEIAEKSQNSYFVASKELNVCKLDHNDVNKNVQRHLSNLDNRQQKHPVVVGDGDVLNVAATAIERAMAMMESDSELFSIGEDIDNHQKDSKLKSSCNRLKDTDVFADSQDIANVTIRYPLQTPSMKGDVEHPRGRTQLDVSTKLEALKSLENLNGKTSPAIKPQKVSTSQVNKRKIQEKQKLKQSSKKAKPDTYRNYSSTSKSEIFVPEKCASIDCCCPGDNTISWVQCDDCDCWYHVACMSCDYQVVRESTAFFHCGCT